MDRFPVELIYILIFLGFIVFNAISQIAARRRQQEEQARAGEEHAAPPPEEEPLEDIWGRTPAPAPVSAPARALAMVERPAPTVRAQPPAPRRMHPVRALLKEPRDLRRAVILMMVLGPCRSQEPPEG